MKWAVASAVFGLLASAAIAADESTVDRAKHEEARACIQCHSLRLIHSQRLSRAAWTKEVDKMIGWGAPVSERQLLIDYYSEQFNDSKPVPTPERSVAGRDVAK